MGFVEDILMWFVCLLIVIPMKIVADILVKLVVDIFMGFMGCMVDILVLIPRGTDLGEPCDGEVTS